MKDQVRVLGIDDAPFKFGDVEVPIVGAMLRSPSYLEAVMTSSVTVDGDDASAKVITMVSSSRYREQIKLILIDGVSLGGFNVVDIGEILERTGIPVATVTRDLPDTEEMSTALKKHFTDWERRLDIIGGRELRMVATKHSPLFVSSVGLSEGELVRTMEGCTVLGVLPEPIRVAHLIATAIVRGESKGDA
ncbi:MAG: DUF99 family protein [Euryarchaeota archaeon]|nr:DUF99 family protein [Euryarchaeota archaeon]